MAIALRQSYISTTKVISAAVQAGDLIVVGMYQDGAQVANSCADNATGGSNTYTKITEKAISDGAGCWVSLFYAVAKGAQTLTITATIGGSGYGLTFAHVYSGTFDPATVLHAFQTKGETSRGTSHTSASLTTTIPNALLVCLWGEPSGSGTISENGAGFTERKEDAGTATYDRIVSATGTYADAVTSTVSAAFASILAAFVEDSGITGSGASVQALQTCAGTGTVTLSGSGGSVQPVQSMGGGGALTLTGTGASTQALPYCEGSGTLAISGIGASIQAYQFGSGMGTNVDYPLVTDFRYSISAPYRSFGIAKPAHDYSISLPARSFEVTL